MYDLSLLYPVVFLFVAGVCLEWLVKRLKLPPVLFLLLVGIILSKIPALQEFLLFPRAFLVGVSVLALVMITYDEFSREKLHHNDSYAHKAVQLTTLLLGLSLVVFGFIIFLNGSSDNPLEVMVFSFMMASVAVPFFGLRSVRLKHFLETEVPINATLVIFTCGLLLAFIEFNSLYALTDSLWYYMAIFSLHLMVGLGAGLVLGLVVFKVFRRVAKHLSHLALLAIVFASYLLAELLNGSGLFAVMALAVLYGAFTIKHKPELEEFSRTFSQAIEILLLLLLGFLISVPLDSQFLLISLIVFAAFLCVRYLCVWLVLRHDYFSSREMSLLVTAAPKSLVAAALALNAVLVSGSLVYLVQILIACMLYGHLVSWLMVHPRVNR